jgi:hypothetical protein
LLTARLILVDAGPNGREVAPPRLPGCEWLVRCPAGAVASTQWARERDTRGARARHTGRGRFIRRCRADRGRGRDGGRAPR